MSGHFRRNLSTYLAWAALLLWFILTFAFLGADAVDATAKYIVR